MTNPVEDAPREIKSLDDVVAVLWEKIKGAIGPDNMSKDERKAHSSTLPSGVLSAEQRRDLLEMFQQFGFHLSSIRNVLRYVPENARSLAERDLVVLTMNSFRISLLTQYNPIVTQWARERAERKGRIVRSGRVPAERVETATAECLDAYLKENPKHAGRTPNDLGKRIAPSVNLKLGCKPGVIRWKPNTLARHVRRIRNGPLSK